MWTARRAASRRCFWVCFRARALIYHRVVKVTAISRITVHRDSSRLSEYDDDVMFFRWSDFHSEEQYSVCGCTFCMLVKFCLSKMLFFMPGHVTDLMPNNLISCWMLFQLFFVSRYIFYGLMWIKFEFMLDKSSQMSQEIKCLNLQFPTRKKKKSLWSVWCTIWYGWNMKLQLSNQSNVWFVKWGLSRLYLFCLTRRQQT